MIKNWLRWTQNRRKNRRTARIHVPFVSCFAPGRKLGSVKAFLKKRKCIILAFFCIVAAFFFIIWDIAAITDQFSLNKQEKLALRAVQELQAEQEKPDSLIVTEIWLNYLGGKTGISVAYRAKREDGAFFHRTQILYFEDEVFLKGPCTYTDEELLCYKQTVSAEEYIGKLWSGKETRSQTEQIRANGGLRIDIEKINRFLKINQAAFWIQRLPCWIGWYWTFFLL